MALRGRQDQGVDIADVESCYRAVKSRDRRFDGVFYTAVHTTGIYCRPSCPAATPQRGNVSFHRTAAGAQAAGFRACKRCLPDATPGSPDWDVAADVAGRAMRLIADGVVEREGVQGLADRIGYSSRHLGRVLTEELGAGPLALARAKRAQTARSLIESTDLGLADVAFAAGFASVRQFNDTIREVYAASPRELRGKARTDTRSGSRSGNRGVGRIELKLGVRAPFHARELHSFLAAHLTPGVEAAGPDWFARTLRLPYGAGVMVIDLAEGDPRAPFVRCTLQLEDHRDLGSAVERCRRLVDADCDPLAVDEALAADRHLAPLVRLRPGLRVPGHVDGDELALRTVIGQQVSVKGANATTGTLVRRFGEPFETDVEGLTHLFPTSEALAEAAADELPMPRARGRALVGLARALADGEVALDRSGDRVGVRSRLLDLPGIGPWTADYIAMRALGDPDVFLPTDLAVRQVLEALPGHPDSDAWRPWRSYALLHLWTHLPAIRSARNPRKV